MTEKSDPMRRPPTCRRSTAAWRLRSGTPAGCRHGCFCSTSLRVRSRSWSPRRLAARIVAAHRLHFPRVSAISVLSRRIKTRLGMKSYGGDCRASLEEELRSIVGAPNLFAGGDIEARYTADITQKYPPQPGFVVPPADTAQIVEIVKLAGRRGVPITPLGGRTGVVGGGMASDGGIILSLERMNRILEIDEQSMT